MNQSHALRFAVALGLITSLGGCEPAMYRPDRGAVSEASNYGGRIIQPDAVTKAKEFLESHLKDPFSAHIEYGEEVKPGCFKDGLMLGGRTHCGYSLLASVNAKNSYGAYIGAVPYVFFFQDGALRLVAENAGMVGETVLWRNL